jgi:hypothetical protein
MCLLNVFCAMQGPRSYFSRQEASNIKKAAIIPSSRMPDYIIDKLSAYIGNIAKFKLIEPGSIDKLLNEMNLQRSDIINLKSIKNIGKILDVDGVIIVSYNRQEVFAPRRPLSAPVDYSISLSAKLVDAETGIILWQAEKSGECSSGDLFSTENTLCKIIVSTLYKLK